MLLIFVHRVVLKLECFKTYVWKWKKNFYTIEDNGMGDTSFLQKLFWFFSNVIEYLLGIFEIKNNNIGI